MSQRTIKLNLDEIIMLHAQQSYTDIHLKDGEEALDFLFGKGKFEGRDINMKPKLILLDLKMPKVNGMEVLHEVKSNEATKKIPVVILTSSKEDPDIMRCYELGANSYIVKPVEFDGFLKDRNVWEHSYGWEDLERDRETLALIDREAGTGTPADRPK